MITWYFTIHLNTKRRKTCLLYYQFFPTKKNQIKEKYFLCFRKFKDDISQFLKKFHKNINFSDERTNWKSENQYIDHIMLCV